MQHPRDIIDDLAYYTDQSKIQELYIIDIPLSFRCPVCGTCFDESGNTIPEAYAFSNYFNFQGDKKHDSCEVDLFETLSKNLKPE